MQKFFKKILLGITLPQEYLCVNLEEFSDPLKIVITPSDSIKELDITDHHLFIGYKPLLIAIDKDFLPDGNYYNSGKLKLSFRTKDDLEVASLVIRLVQKVKLNSTTCLLFEGEKGIHSFDNPVHKFINALRYNLTAERKKNIFLPGNLYDQVKIAYSIPRKICLTTVSSGNLINIFPIDISGPLNEKHFIISLRSSGKANRQIEYKKNCLVSIMDANSSKEVYNAGKNHMRELSVPDKLGISLRNETSDRLKFPIPSGAIKYYELEKIDKFEIGIHTIYYFNIVNSVILSHKKNVLAHIHRDYAQWREKNNITTSYLMNK